MKGIKEGKELQQLRSRALRNAALKRISLEDANEVSQRCDEFEEFIESIKENEDAS